MENKMPKRAAFFVRMLTPKFKGSLRRNIDGALDLCKTKSAEEIEEEIAKVEEKIIVIRDRITAERPVELGGISKVIQNVSDYGEKYIAKLSARQKGSVGFDATPFERLSNARIRLARTSIFEKMILIRNRREAQSSEKDKGA